MAQAPRSTAAFDELLAALAEARDSYALSDERGFNEVETVEAYRYILHMVSESIDLIVDADPERPRFTCMVSPSRKYLGDNPDSMYYQATIRDDRAYRIKGRKDGQTYVSFTIHAADPAGGINGPILADINDDDPADAGAQPRPQGGGDCADCGERDQEDRDVDEQRMRGESEEPVESEDHGPST